MRRCGIAAALLAVARLAAGQTGEVAVGYAWQDVAGSDEAFASHYNLSGGVFLEELRLDLRRALDNGHSRFDVVASGFGAEPNSRASLAVAWDHEWSLRLDYSRRESFFASPSFDLGVRRDHWAITRWTGALTYDGWSWGRVRLDARDVRRSGSEQLAFYGLGQRYVARVGLDERIQELGVSLETKTLPVKIVIEQDYARFLRRNRAEPANGGQPADAADPDFLSLLDWPGEDENLVPTTRLSAVYRDERFEVAGQGLYRSDRLDADRNDVTGWTVGGGSIGEVGFVDAVTGSADRNHLLGEVRLGVAVAPFLTLRLRGRLDDASTDSSLIGQRLLRALGPGGGAEVGIPVAETAFVDRRDTDLAAEADIHRGPFGLVIAYHDASREVDYRLAEDRHVTRDASAWRVTGSYSPGRAFSVELGWADRSFSDHVFRIDADTVERLWLKLRLRPSAGFELSGYAEREEADNPAAVAGLARRGTLAGVAATYTSSGGAFVTASADSFDLTSEVATEFFAPGAITGLSRYDTDVLTVSLRGGVPLAGRLKLSGGLLALADDGDSLPFDLTSYDLRAEAAISGRLELSLFGALWSYDLEHSDQEDYDVVRYGLSLRWRF